MRSSRSGSAIIGAVFLICLASLFVFAPRQSGPATAINAVSSSLNTSVKTDPIVVVKSAASALVVHNCQPQPPIQPEDCEWTEEAMPEMPYVPCPEGEHIDWECNTDCLAAWFGATDHAKENLRAALGACCADYNTALAQLTADYDADIAAAEAAFVACTKSPARCEYEYCVAIAEAWAAYSTTQTQLYQEYLLCEGLAFSECAIATYSASLIYATCALGCCQ